MAMTKNARRIWRVLTAISVFWAIIVISVVSDFDTIDEQWWYRYGLAIIIILAIRIVDQLWRISKPPPRPISLPWEHEPDA